MRAAGEAEVFAHRLARDRCAGVEQARHEVWEGRAFALFAATFVFAGYTVDEFRHGIEKMSPPQHYLESSYYEHWLATFEEALTKRGFVTREELDARMAQLRKGGQ